MGVNKNYRPALKAKDLLPVLDADLSKGPGDVILPCTEIRQAKHLGWYVAEVRAANKNLNPFTSLPMICQAEECYWAGQCETAPDFLWKGLKCPLEVMDIYKHWVGYIKELEVGPANQVDLKMVYDLVRIDLQMTRIDQQIQIGGMEADKVGGIIQGADGRAVMEKQVHPLLVYQSKLRKDRNEIYKQLVASRDAKRIAKQAEGKAEDNLLSLFSKLSKMSPLPRVEEVYDVEPKALPEETEDTDFSEE